MSLRVFLPVACLVLLPSMCLAQNPPAPGVQQDPQTRAEALLDKARQLSDIRSPHSPAFRLKATFSFIGTDLEIVQGTFTEVWASNEQWRRETIVKDYRRVEVGGANRMWKLDNTEDFPEQAAELPRLPQVFPSKSKTFNFESISDRPDANPPAECALTPPDSSHQKSAFCFDKKDGLLLESFFPESRSRNVVENSCDYGSFQKIGVFLFPREMTCFEDRHRKLDAKVVELSLEPSPDPALFAHPAGALELGICPVKAEPPRAVSAPSPRWPVGARDQGSQVMLSLVVDSKGKAQNVKVVNSAGARIDQAAVTTVRNWRFKPAICNGEPMPAMINVQVDFRLYR